MSLSKILFDNNSYRLDDETYEVYRYNSRKILVGIIDWDEDIIINWVHKRFKSNHIKRSTYKPNEGIYELDLCVTDTPNTNSNIQMYDDENGNMIIRHIEWFYKSSQKCDNGPVNQIREKIINDIINDDIPFEWLNDYKWFYIANKIWNYLEVNKPFDYTSISCKKIGGRKNNDLNITYHNSDLNLEKTIKIEFKYNASDIQDCPQWVSPMHPSKFMNNNFEEYHYNNYLQNICDIYNLEKPIKEDFIKRIHCNEPECVRELQSCFYKGSNRSRQFTGNIEDINRYKKCKEISYISIEEFLKVTDIHLDKLNESLIKSQKDKEYMLFDTNSKTFKHEKPDVKDYTVKEIIKKTKNTFIGLTESGKKINILLRWKNGSGIAFPAFQIK